MPTDPAIDWPGWQRLSPVLRYANFYDAQPGKGFGPRTIADFQILIVQKGSGRAVIGSERLAITAGDLLFYGPRTVHEVVSSVDQPLRLLGIHFLFMEEDLGRLPPNIKPAQAPAAFPRGLPRCPLRPAPPARTAVGWTGAARWHCEALVLSYIADATGRPLEKRGLLFLLFQAWREDMVRQAREPAMSLFHRRAIEQALVTIQANLREPPGIAVLARQAGMTPNYFARQFKRHTGRTIKGLIVRERLLQARRLLVEGELNVAQAAAAVGFDDPFYFSRLFHQHMGVAPSVLRASRQLR